MGYLTLNHDLSTTDKVVISVWFRVSKAGIKYVQDQTPPPWGSGYRILFGVVPLISWGPSQDVTITDVVTVDTGAMTVDRSPIVTQKLGPTHIAPIGPSWLGIMVGGKDWPFETPALSVNIQTNVRAQGSGLAFINTDWTGDFSHNDFVTGKPIYANVKYTSTDVSNEIITKAPEYFGNTDFAIGNAGPNAPAVAVEHWHHLLISWSLNSITNSIGSVCKMWCALDDVDMAGDNLPAYHDSDTASGMEAHDHKSSLTFAYQGEDVPPLDEAPKIVSLSIDSDSVPFDPIVIPASPLTRYTTDAEWGVGTKDPVGDVELAELQIFTGVTVDTTQESNRRAFIDKNGKPVAPDQKAENGSDGDKVSDGGSIELLGKRPEILLHTTGNWQKGKNTGTMGQNDEGEAIPSGQFKPSGKILSYKPDPSLHGPQGSKT